MASRSPDTTDFERLRQYELIYTGVLRTNIATILRCVNLSGKKYKLSTELFSITADVYRVLGNIDEADYACDTPDSQSRDLEACYQRIARVLLCDVSELGRENAHEVAKQVEHAQINELAEALAFQATGVRVTHGRRSRPRRVSHCQCCFEGRT